MSKCLHPPSLTESQIAHYLAHATDHAANGERSAGDAAMAAIEEHLAHCPHCAARVQSIIDLETRITKTLSPGPCLDHTVLQDFLFDLLTPAEAARVVFHVNHCALCTRQVLEMHRVLLEPSGFLEPTPEIEPQPTTPENSPRPETNAQPGGWRNLALYVLDLLRLPPASGAPLPALRGAPSTGQQTLAQGPIQLHLARQGANEGNPRATVRGLLAGIAPDQTQVHIWQSENLLHILQIDEFGEFEVNLPSDVYDIIVAAPGVKAQFNHVPL